MRAEKVRVQAETKANARLEKSKEKYLRSTAKKVRKANEKSLASRRKHEEKMAKAALARIKTQGFTKANVLKGISTFRTLVPAVMPLMYRGMTKLQEVGEKSQAQRAGVSSSDVAQFASDGATHKARIKKLRRDLKDGTVPAGFAQDVSERLDELDKAIDNASAMKKQQSKNALEAVDRQLTLVRKQLQMKRG